MAEETAVAAGQAVYTPRTLALYDWFVLGFSNRLLWRCPTARLRALYDANVGRRHLDIGVGTGYFLDKARWPVEAPEITLLDLNRDCLERAARRIARYAPKRIAASCLAPLPSSGPFDSIGLCYLLHCLPGSIPEKAAVFDHAGAVLAEGGVLFGATILQGETGRSGPAQALMNFYNRKGVFSNAGDTLQDLEDALSRRFAEVTLERIGMVALFRARGGVGSIAPNGT